MLKEAGVTPGEEIPETEDTQEHPILSGGEGSDPEMPA